MTTPALRVDSLVKDYKGGVRAVDGVSFSVEPGEVFALLGPNGAGKTTTIKAVVTLLRPTSGTVEVCGHDVVQAPDAARAALGYVPQELALDRHLTGRQHLALSARLYHVPRAEQEARVAALLEVVDLTARADDSIKTYSGGMKKRLDIACGLLHRPRLLILDEPTLGLDLQTRYRIWSFVAGLRAEGTAVLLTTHDMEEADHLSDRIAIVDHGQLQAQGTGAELKAAFGGERVVAELGRVELSEPQREQLRGLPGVLGLEERGRSLLFVSESGRELAPRVAEWLERETGAPPRSLSFGPPGLDDVFLKITGHDLRDDERVEVKG
ncbi:MAG: ATP-binding cassette domain-containing protein [Planctomycetota bacterium]